MEEEEQQIDVDVDMDHIGGVEEDCESEESDDEDRNSTRTWRTFQVCWLATRTIFKL